MNLSQAILALKDRFMDIVCLAERISPMKIRFGAELKVGQWLYRPSQNTEDEVRKAFNKVAQDDFLQDVLKNTDPAIRVTLRGKAGDTTTYDNEAVVEIRKPVDELPDNLKKYDEPQSFRTFNAAWLVKSHDSLNALRYYIVSKIHELDKTMKQTGQSEKTQETSAEDTETGRRSLL